MPAIDGGPQEDPRWNEKDEPTKIKLTPKFDLQNMDVKLYLALRKLTVAAMHMVPESTIEAAKLALAEFELSMGGLPEWAVDRNWDYSLVPGAQLCTKDGRRTGNAHIIKMGEGIAAGPVFLHTYECLTDAGSKMIFTEQELNTAFSIGDWISDPARIIARFDHDNHYRQE